jgi:hypothetical protein
MCICTMGRLRAIPGIGDLSDDARIGWRAGVSCYTAHTRDLPVRALVVVRGTFDARSRAGLGISPAVAAGRQAPASLSSPTDTPRFAADVCGDSHDVVKHRTIRKPRNNDNFATAAAAVRRTAPRRLGDCCLPACLHADAALVVYFVVFIFSVCVTNYRRCQPRRGEGGPCVVYEGNPSPPAGHDPAHRAHRDSPRAAAPVEARPCGLRGGCNLITGQCRCSVGYEGPDCADCSSDYYSLRQSAPREGLYDALATLYNGVYAYSPSLATSKYFWCGFLQSTFGGSYFAGGCLHGQRAGKLAWAIYF